LSLSQFVPLSAYEFNDENAPQDFLPLVTFPCGAAHTSKLQCLFNSPITVPRPLLNEQLPLSSSMQHYGNNFAKSATPNGSSRPAWQKSNAAEGKFQSPIPRSPMQETTVAANHKCAFWAALRGAQ
jgi:para-nitrobenzyl esterase